MSACSPGGMPGAPWCTWRHQRNRGCGRLNSPGQSLMWACVASHLPERHRDLPRLRHHQRSGGGRPGRRRLRRRKAGRGIGGRTALQQKSGLNSLLLQPAGQQCRAGAELCTGVARRRGGRWRRCAAGRQVHPNTPGGKHRHPGPAHDHNWGNTRAWTSRAARSPARRGPGSAPASRCITEAIMIAQIAERRSF